MDSINPHSESQAEGSSLGNNQSTTLRGLDENNNPDLSRAREHKEVSLAAIPALRDVDWRDNPVEVVNGTQRRAAKGQQIGMAAPGGQCCRRCSRNKGVFSSCVVCSVNEMLIFGGACMNCAFIGRAAECSFRQRQFSGQGTNLPNWTVQYRESSIYNQIDPSLHLNMGHPNESHGAGAAAGDAAPTDTATGAATAGAALTEGSSPNSAGLTTATTPAASMTPLASPPVSGSATQAAEADVPDTQPHFTWEDVLDPLTFPTYFSPAWGSINDPAEELAIRDGLLRIQADVFNDLQASQKRIQDSLAQQNNS